MKKLRRSRRSRLQSARRPPRTMTRQVKGSTQALSRDTVRVTASGIPSASQHHSKGTEDALFGILNRPRLQSTDFPNCLPPVRRGTSDSSVGFFPLGFKALQRTSSRRSEGGSFESESAVIEGWCPGSSTCVEDAAESPPYCRRKLSICEDVKGGMSSSMSESNIPALLSRNTVACKTSTSNIDDKGRFETCETWLSEDAGKRVSHVQETMLEQDARHRCSYTFALRLVRPHEEHYMAFRKYSVHCDANFSKAEAMWQSCLSR